MQVQINTGHNIDGHETLLARFRHVVESALIRFSDRVTRVEVHLSDENGQKSGPDDKRCMIEARLEGSPANGRHSTRGDLGPSRRRRRRQDVQIDREYPRATARSK